ncbi:MAG TPA: flagellar motor protein MotB [Phycisphaerae bacterium]|nr:flagellar motor protein MotB [Phycisphaerae bacterium]
MAAKPSITEDAPSGPGAWVVSFNDCMTNMLCFFVMLVSFSAFDAGSLGRIRGAFKGMSLDSIFHGKKMLVDSLMPSDWTVDRTEKGAEQPVDFDPVSISNPRQRPLVPRTDAYRDRTDLYLPANHVFWARGTLLTPHGRKCLDMTAALLRKNPRRVIVSAYEPRGAQSRDSRNRLDRCLAVADYLAAGAGLRPSLLGISAASVPRSGHDDRSAFIRITLLKQELVR